MTKSKKSFPLDLGQLFFIVIIIGILVAWAVTSDFDIVPESPSSEDNKPDDSLLELIGRWKYTTSDNDIFLLFYVGDLLEGQWSIGDKVVEKFTWSREGYTITLDYHNSDRKSDELFLQEIDNNHLSILNPYVLFLDLFDFIPNENVLVFQRVIS